MNNTLKVLIIAKEKDCEQINLALDKSSIKIELQTAINSDQGIIALKNKRYDCLLLEQTLLEQNLSQLINKLQLGENTFPVIVINAKENSGKLINCMPIEVIEYLQKSTILAGNLEYIIKNAIRIHATETVLKTTCHKLNNCQKILINRNRKIEQQQQEINSQKLQISQLSRQKSLFLKIISHELRTPMNSIIGFSQLLLHDKSHSLNQEQADMINRILTNSKHLLMLLNQMIDYTKIHTGKLKLKPEIFNLSNLVDQTVREIKILAKAKNLSLLFNVELENKLIVNDRLKLEKILINLLSNAVKFTESGGIFLHIAETSKKQLTITVKDTGIGINKQKLPEIFVPFTQVEQGNTRKYSGVGIGLATIEGLVKIMGGKIYIQSQIGLGTKIQIVLPLNMKFSENLFNKVEDQIIEDIQIIKQPSNMVIGNCYHLKQG
ncbi:hybrid sensor histidine kinase/response regulator [Anabaena sp. FACHB-1237]|uniref:sensor histidine kinase n=1 Tax=Anabaena sp. FACHB-1237 TaxID=2692769 RepID=UPI0016809820|nr:ATP-binding protein [Anabaena sp. FACHB-1237]MBD2136667.1 hybrid sensor histidine kinase/response regulator [Anabaena sp. FACHB-1237]